MKDKSVKNKGSRRPDWIDHYIKYLLWEFGKFIRTPLRGKKNLPVKNVLHLLGKTKS